MGTFWYRRAVILFFASAVGGFLLFSATAESLGGGSRGHVERPKVVLVVLDGGDWQPIRDLLERDRLPAIDRIMREEAYGDIVTPKAFSPITWTKIGTGHQAADLNVRSWKVQTNDGPRIVQSGDVKHRRIWDYLNAAGIRTGITNYFLTWPVTPVKGFMIAVTAAQSDTNLQYPEGFLPRDLLLGRGNEWKIANAVLNRTDGGDGYPFLAFGFKGLDAIQHSLWKYLVPDAFGVERGSRQRRMRAIIYDQYTNLDRFIARFDRSWNVIVVSDSGFRADGGYRAQNLTQFYNRNAPRGFVYPTYEGNLDPLVEAIGYGEELRWCSIDYPKPDYLNATTYLFRLCLTDESVNVTRAIHTLNQVEYRNGRHFFEGVHYDTDAGSIVGRWRLFESGVVNTTIMQERSHQPTFGGTIPEVHKFLGLRLPGGTPFNLDIGPEKSGDHPGYTNGIFLARGPAIADTDRVRVHAVDIAPTLLYMYNLPIPQGMDGRPVLEIFTEEFNAERTIRYRKIDTRRTDAQNVSPVNESQEKALKEKLRGLGYLD